MATNRWENLSVLWWAWKVNRYKEAFADFIRGNQLNADQMQFVQMIIFFRGVSANGVFKQ